MEVPFEFTNDACNSDSSFEPVSVGDRGRAKVLISNLRKKYSDGKVAVKQLSLSMLEGQITCLLGHNGAGISILDKQHNFI
jgi:ABC-type transport system involved in cytochrome bd biosynthesis fused ATPase/permease subunit